MKEKKKKKETGNEACQQPAVSKEGEGLPKRRCADISKNLLQRFARFNATHDADNIIFERLYLVSRLGTFFS